MDPHRHGYACAMKYRLALFAAAVVALLGAVTAMFVARFDPTDAGEAVRDYVRERYGRELQLEGPMALSLWPVLSVEVPRARLSEVGSDAQAASFERANVEIAWLPLIRGRVIVERLRVKGLQARIEQRTDGSHNIDNLIDPLAVTPDTAPGDEPPARALRVEVGRVELSEASIEYESLASGQRIWLDDIELKLDEIGARMVTPITFRARMLVTPGGPNALVRVSGTLDVDPNRRTVGLRGVEASARGFMAGQAIDANARARRASISLGRAGLVGQLESFAIGFKGAGQNWAMDAAHARGTSLEFDASRFALASTGVEVNAKGRIEGESFEAGLALPEVSIGHPNNRGKPIELSARIRGTRELELKLSLEGVSGGGHTVAASRITVAADSTDGALSGALRLSGALSADLDTASIHISQIAGALSIETGTGQPTLKLPVTGSLHVGLASGTVDTEIGTRIESSEWRSTARYDPSLQQGRLSVTVNADQVDLDRLLALFGPVATALSSRDGGAPNQASSRSALPGARATISVNPGASVQSNSEHRAADLANDSILARFTASDWKAEVKLGQFQAGALRASSVEAALQTMQPGLRVQSLSAVTHGGTVQAQGEWRIGDEPSSVRARARSIDAGPFLEALTASKRLEGKADVQAELSGRIDSGMALSRIRGQLSLRLTEGRLLGVDMAGAARERAKRIRATRERRNADENPAPSPETETTDFSLLSASFAIRDGQARSRDMLIETPLVRANGAASIDLDRRLIDANLRLGIRNTGGDSLLAAIARLSLPVQVRGPLSAPEWNLDPAALSGPRTRP